MNITKFDAQVPKHRRFLAFMAAAVLLTALSGCVVEPVGYYGHPHYWHDRY